MNARIAQLRKKEGMTQKKFAEKIGVSENYVWMMEKGDRVPSDRTISDVYREFGVNEGWLRTGEGEMYIPKTRNDQLVDFFREILGADDNDFLRSFCTALASMDKDQLHQLANLSESVLTKWVQLKEKRETEQKEKADP